MTKPKKAGRRARGKKLYTTKDVEALVAMAIAAYNYFERLPVLPPKKRRGGR